MPRSRPVVFVGLCVLLAFALAGCSSVTPSAPPSTTSVGTSGTPATTAVPPIAHAAVSMSDTAFKPAKLTVKAGTVVTWTDAGTANHSIAFDDGSVRSPVILSGQKASHVFSDTGTFDYHDGLHPEIKGTVVVTK
jgi:plastocyanin